MREVVANLLGNAIKYTPEGGSLSVLLDAVSAGDRLSVTVSDTGIGIPKEELPRIFEDFHRAPNAKEFAPDGTGLGLSIVRHIVVPREKRPIR